MTWTKALIQEKLETSRVMVERSLLKLYERQTTDEQAMGQTVVHNKRGFTAFDAEILTSFAEQIRRNRYGKPEGQRLTDRQLEVARKRVKHYWKQLLEEATNPAPVPTDDAAAIARADRDDARLAAEAKRRRDEQMGMFAAPSAVSLGF